MSVMFAGVCMRACDGLRKVQKRRESDQYSCQPHSLSPHPIFIRVKLCLPGENFISQFFCLIFRDSWYKSFNLKVGEWILQGQVSTLRTHKWLSEDVEKEEGTINESMWHLRPCVSTSYRTSGGGDTCSDQRSGNQGDVEWSGGSSRSAVASWSRLDPHTADSISASSGPTYSSCPGISLHPPWLAWSIRQSSFQLELGWSGCHLCHLHLLAFQRLPTWLTLLLGWWLTITVVQIQTIPSLCPMHVNSFFSWNPEPPGHSQTDFTRASEIHPAHSNCFASGWILGLVSKCVLSPPMPCFSSEIQTFLGGAFLQSSQLVLWKESWVRVMTPLQFPHV